LRRTTHASFPQLAHSPELHELPAWHCEPHEPQFFESLVMSTQTPLQSVSPSAHTVASEPVEASLAPLWHEPSTQL
jgi:hypothetical protein